MDYRLELLNDSQFENLVNRVCQLLLGMNMVSFSEGKDGGRDGKFTGKANRYPSENECWKGNFIIQAKHTSNPIASCSDSDFNTIINKEIKKVKKLKNNNQVDCYLLFTNRKYTGIVGEKLVQRLITETGVLNISIIGKETLNDLYINPNNEIIKEFGLDLHHIPFVFSETDVKEIILEFNKELSNITDQLQSIVENIKYDFNRINIEEKNKKNKLSKEYYENEILSHSLQDFDKIDAFLKDSRNDEFKELYYDIASELRNTIQIKRSNFVAFEEIFIFIYHKITDGSKIKGKRHIFTLLHYMYYECLIGVK